MTVIVEQSALLVESGGQTTEFQGRDHGSAVSFIMVSTDTKGAGPALHQHPYDETFVIRRGEPTFVVGDETVTGRAGQIIVVPPRTPHKFTNTGSGRLEMIDIHASDVFITEWLEQ